MKHSGHAPHGSLEDGTSSSTSSAPPAARQHGRRSGAGALARLRSVLANPANTRALAYGLMNVLSASGIVFANKSVLTSHGYHFTFALTWIHTAFTLAGMQLFVRSGLFPAKRLPAVSVTPLAAAFVAYIVLCNLSLKVNTVGFYQVMKIAVAPTVLLLELLMFGSVPPPRVAAAVLVVCAGVAVATVSDTHMVRNTSGIAVGMAATVMTALYQIWAGSKQRELKATSMQLLYAYTPQATLMLGVLVPLCEPMGWSNAAPGTLLGYHYTGSAVIAILISAVLGLLVSLSTFLVIGATSSLTYNVVGHLKTLIILTGGCVFFGDEMPPQKLAGVGLAMAGIVWYTQLKLTPTTSAAAAAAAAGEAPVVTGSKRPLLPVSMEGLGSRSVFTLGGVSARRGANAVMSGGSALAAAAAAAVAGGPAANGGHVAADSHAN